MASAESEFEVHLVSDASHDIFQNNTLSSFTTSLQEEILLEGTWVVALTEISFPTSVQNIPSGEFVELKREEKVAGGDGATVWKTVKNNQGYPMRSEIPPGTYHDVDDIMEVLDGIMGGVIEWDVDSISKKLQVKVVDTKKNGAKVNLRFMSRTIPTMLGLRGDEIGWPAVDTIPDTRLVPSIKTTFTTAGMDPVDMTWGKHLLFVYINIIDHQTVGDTKAPLLRLIPILHKQKNCKLQESTSLTYRSFNDLQYKRLLKSSFRYFHIELRTETGHFYPFSSIGNVALTLKFRKLVRTT